MSHLARFVLLAALMLHASPLHAAVAPPESCDLTAQPPTTGPHDVSPSPAAPPPDVRAAASPAASTEPTGHAAVHIGLLERMSLGPPVPTFQGGWLLDHLVREGLRARTHDGQQRAHVASNMLVWSLILTPFISGGVQVLAQGGGPLALTEIEMVGLEAFGTSMLTAWLLHVFLGRERPFATAEQLAARCHDPSTWETHECHSDRNASFLSGHSASSFTAAGLLCAQAVYLSEPTAVWPAVLCGGAMTTAATTAMLRIVADRHYATDILAGMILGVTSGFVIPVILHMRPDAPLPVARSLASTHAAHDDGAVLGSAVIGFLAGGFVPMLTTAFRSERAPTRAAIARRLQSFAIVPLVWPEAGGAVLASSW